MNYQQSNWLMDEVLPAVEGNVFKIISVIARQSWGWQYASVQMSYTDFEEATGMSRATVSKNLDKALSSGFLIREQNGQDFIYTVVTSLESKLVKYQNQFRTYTSTSLEPELDQFRNDTSSSLESELVTSSPKEDKEITKEKGKNNNLSPEPWEEEPQEINFKQPAEKDPLEELLEVFCELTHIPPPPSYHNGNGDKWINPMVRVYEATGEDFVKTKQCIIEAVTILKEKSYTIASPKSVLTAALSVASRLEQQELNGLFKPQANEPKGYAAIRQVMAELESGEFEL